MPNIPQFSGSLSFVACARSVSWPTLWIPFAFSPNIQNMRIGTQIMGQILFQPKFLEKSLSRYWLTKNHHPVAELLDGFRDLHAHPCPRGARAQIWARKLEFSKIDQNQACMYSTCRSQCPEHQDNFLFEIGLKLTELRGITRCPYMVASANFGYFCAIKWPNLNIFQWDLFYMISTLELHHISKF